ncbi:MAG TPA: hypothetical protein VIJ79_10465 [Acidobacteriaceae bacterium]
MMPTPSRIILLVEDAHHEQFIRKYLKILGFGGRDLRLNKSPHGTGSAEQWVREQFANEVDACRRRHAQTKLIVLIDADTRTVLQRMRQLDQALHEAGYAPIDNSTGEILRLVPRRNIETWILCLNNRKVDEETDYKSPNDNWGDLIRTAVAELYAWTRPNAVVPASCVESLHSGMRELQKLSF